MLWRRQSMMDRLGAQPGIESPITWLHHPTCKPEPAPHHRSSQTQESLDHPDRKGAEAVTSPSRSVSSYSKKLRSGEVNQILPRVNLSALSYQIPTILQLVAAPADRLTDRK